MLALLSRRVNGGVQVAALHRQVSQPRHGTTAGVGTADGQRFQRGQSYQLQEGEAAQRHVRRHQPVGGGQKLAGAGRERRLLSEQDVAGVEEAAPPPGQSRLSRGEAEPRQPRPQECALHLHGGRRCRVGAQAEAAAHVAIAGRNQVEPGTAASTEQHRAVRIGQPGKQCLHGHGGAQIRGRDGGRQQTQQERRRDRPRATSSSPWWNPAWHRERRGAGWQGARNEHIRV